MLDDINDTAVCVLWVGACWRDRLDAVEPAINDLMPFFEVDLDLILVVPPKGATSCACADQERTVPEEVTAGDN